MKGIPQVKMILDQNHLVFQEEVNYALKELGECVESFEFMPSIIPGSFCCQIIYVEQPGQKLTRKKRPTYIGHFSREGER